MKRQTRQVLVMLRTFPDGLTGIDALREAGVYRLAARIAELRGIGLDITCDRSEGFGRYRLNVGPCIFTGCVSRDRHWHGGFPGGWDNPEDPEGPPIDFTTTPTPGVRDYNGALLDEPRQLSLEDVSA